MIVKVKAENRFAPVPILAAGCAFPSGPNLRLADMAARTNLCLFRHHPDYVDQCGYRVRCSIFPPPVQSTQRWLELIHAALQDLLSHVPQTAKRCLERREVALWLVLPESGRPGVPADLGEQLSDLFNPHWAQIRLTKGQHTATADAIVEAASWTDQTTRFAVVLAADTPYDCDTLRWLERRELLNGARKAYRDQARANPYGRVAGEGAAAIMVGPPGYGSAWCRITGLARAQERSTFDKTEPCLGKGLTAAALRAIEIAALPAHDITCLIHDANGEPGRSDEFAYTALRLTDKLAKNWERSIPAIASGDLLTASLATHVTIASWRINKSSSRPFGGTTLVLGSSDSAERAALVLQKGV